MAALFLPAAVGKAIINFFYMCHGFLVFVYTLCIVYNKVIGEMESFCHISHLKTGQNTKGDFSMVKLYDGGIYLVNGREIVTDPAALPGKCGRNVTKEEAEQGTIAYGILRRTTRAATCRTCACALTA